MVAILDRTPEAILSYSKTGQVSKAVMDAIQKAGELKGKVVQLESQMQELNKQKQSLVTAQDRLRKNIETVGKDSEPGKNFVAKLVDMEKQIDGLDAKMGDLQKAIDSARNDLANYLKNLNVE
jgi:seryl-tRNA synthetase